MRTLDKTCTTTLAVVRKKNWCLTTRWMFEVTILRILEVATTSSK